MDKTRRRRVERAYWRGVEQEEQGRDIVILCIRSREWQLSKRLRGEVMQ